VLVIKIVQAAAGFSSDHAGQYIRSFVPDTDEFGQGVLVTTANLNDALKFETWPAAFEFWKQQSRRCPTRTDGKPNRPLTAFTVTFESVIEQDEVKRARK